MKTGELYVFDDYPDAFVLRLVLGADKYNVNLVCLRVCNGKLELRTNHESWIARNNERLA